MTSDELIELIINGSLISDAFAKGFTKEFGFFEEKQKKGEDEPLLPILLDLIEQELKKRSKQTSTEPDQ